MVMAGKDKGKTGKVLQIFVEENRASIEGINLLIKHLRPHKQGEKGQRVEFPSPMNISNLMLLCPKCGKATRPSRKHIAGDANRKGSKVRVCKKCQATID